MSAELGGGQWVSVEYFAVLGAHRQVLHIPGVAHGNPIPMGVRAGRYLFSSRVLPMDPATGKPGPDAETQTELVFANVDALLEVGGMAWGDVAQGRAFLADLDSLSLVRERWAARGAGGALHPLQYQVAPSLLVMLEIFAARR
jgi:enamine deaminase RidA (YjgF/YER057c/UK114 family)